MNAPSDRHKCLPFRRLTAILRGVPAKRVMIVAGDQRKRVMIVLENPIGVGPNEKRPNLSYATV